MPDVIAKLADGACPLAPTDVFTAVVKTSVVAIDVSNPTGVTQTTEVKLNGAILFSVVMPASGGINWHGPQVLEIGQRLNIVAGSASCHYNVTGVEIT